MFFLAALFVCGTWSNCPAETECFFKDNASHTFSPYEYPSHEYECTNILGKAPERGNIYVYAIPCPDDDPLELFDIDKVWGGAHATIGFFDHEHKLHPTSNPTYEQMKTQAVANFKSLGSFLDSDPSFVENSPWSPKSEDLTPTTRKQCTTTKNGKTTNDGTYHGMHFNFPIDESKTPLGKIITHIQAQPWSSKPRGEPTDKILAPDNGPWFQAKKKGGFHISAVESGHNTHTPNDIKRVLTSTHWHLALVEVNTTLNRLDYLATFPINNLKSNFIPEPTTLLLALLALVATPLRVRHG
jgi:hypothetical protein